MPSLDFNKSTWDGTYNWQNGGDEWSAGWGGPFMQWHGSILPRIKAHVPANTILEIACGYGRWTHYLKDLCEQLTVVDISEECINACKQRFSTCRHINYYVNDGTSLEMIPSNSIDFVFSYDSLVHADDFVIDGYISQLSRILSTKGVAFIHHSNFGEYQEKYSKLSKIPLPQKFLRKLGILEQDLHLRDPNVDAMKVRTLAEKHGLKCVRQEIVPWFTRRLFIDCISTISRNGSPTEADCRIFKNANFMKEAQNLTRIAESYSFSK